MSLLKSKNEVITYTVDKTSNSSLYISIQNGEVIVKAPWYYTTKQIQEVVEEKKNWILKHLKEYIEAENIKKQKVNTDPIYILGNQYDLILKYANAKNPTLNLFKKHIEIILPVKYLEADKTKIINSTLSKMYTSIAKEELEFLMEDIRHLLGFAPEDFQIKPLGDLLAKCSNKIITINPSILQYSREIIRFIIIHEFCHLKYKNNTKGFNEIMEKYIFNYEKILTQVQRIKILIFSHNQIMKF